MQRDWLGEHLRNDLFCIEWDVKPWPVTSNVCMSLWNMVIMHVSLCLSVCLCVCVQRACCSVINTSSSVCLCVCVYLYVCLCVCLCVSSEPAPMSSTRPVVSVCLCLCMSVCLSVCVQRACSYVINMSSRLLPSVTCGVKRYSRVSSWLCVVMKYFTFIRSSSATLTVSRGRWMSFIQKTVFFKPNPACFIEFLLVFHWNEQW